MAAITESDIVSQIVTKLSITVYFKTQTLFIQCSVWDHTFGSASVGGIFYRVFDRETADRGVGLQT
jgi:hypothetical protein